MGGVAAEGGGDVAVAGAAQHADHGVADGGEHLRRGAGAHLAAVFIQGDVAHPVQPILDPQWPRQSASSRRGVARCAARLVTA